MRLLYVVNKIVLETSSTKQEEYRSYKQKSDNLRSDLEKKDVELNILRKDLEEKTKSLKDVRYNFHLELLF